MELIRLPLNQILNTIFTLSITINENELYKINNTS